MITTVAAEAAVMEVIAAEVVTMMAATVVAEAAVIMMTATGIDKYECGFLKMTKPRSHYIAYSE